MNVLEFINIADKDFDPKEYGLEGMNYDKYMHVRDADGSIKTKVDSFRAIWRALGYKRILKISNISLFKPFFNLGYEIFALIRPYLPKKDYCEIF